MPMASAVPRESTASIIPSAAHTASMNQPAASARTRSHADGPSTSASSVRATTTLATAPPTKTAIANPTSATPSASSLPAKTARRPGRCVKSVFTVSQP